MPFQSEKQRRYLWANEPEIARDWTDTYGSRIEKSNGLVFSWYESGSKKEQEYFTSGIANGVHQQWYENGQKIKNP